MTGTQTVPNMDAATRKQLSAVGWLLTARYVVWLASMVALAWFATDLTMLVPGPDVADAIVVSLAAGATLAVRVPFDALIRRLLEKVYGADALRAPDYDVVVPGLVVAVGALVVWIALVARGDLVVIPVLMIVTVFVLERPAAFLIGREERPLNDPALERRLRRFTREMALGDLKFRVSKDDKTRSPTQTEPKVTILAELVSVPRELIDDPPDVLETRLAAAIVRSRKRRHAKLSLVAGMFALVTSVIVVGFEGSLFRISHTSDITDPAFVPTALLVMSIGVVATSPVRAMYNRWSARREIGDVLNLTRSPDAMLALIARDTDTIGQANPLRRIVSGRPSARACLAEVERWRQSRRITLLFTDIANSTELLNELGDARWYGVVADHDHVVRTVIEEFDGDEIDSAGDGFFVVFTDAGRALLAAVELQRRLREIEAVAGTPLAVRMGVHVGDAIRRGREVVGREVNLAARIGASAVPGEILVSQELQDELAESARFTFGDPRAASFKGFSDEHIVYPVAPREDEPSVREAGV